jgi:hypothetical protein
VWCCVSLCEKTKYTVCSPTSTATSGGRAAYRPSNMGTTVGARAVTRHKGDAQSAGLMFTFGVASMIVLPIVAALFIWRCCCSRSRRNSHRRMLELPMAANWMSPACASARYAPAAIEGESEELHPKWEDASSRRGRSMRKGSSALPHARMPIAVSFRRAGWGKGVSVRCKLSFDDVRTLQVTAQSLPFKQC